MTDHVLEHLKGPYAIRYLSEGVPYGEWLRIRDRIRSFDEWCDVWSEFAQQAETDAAEALAAGQIRTAAVHFKRATLYYCYGQLLFWHAPETKRIAYQNCARVWRRAAPYLDPPQHPVEIPYRGITMPGFLRLPHGVKKPPCVILLGGLDSTKEELQEIADLCVARGLATLAFDGPGQGETFFHMKLAPDFVEAVRAVVDFAARHPELDGDRIGIIGRSLGGYYAPRAAALDKRIKACAAWGAMFHLRNWRTLPALTAAGFVYTTGSKTLEEARPYIESIDLADVASDIACPLLIVHGGADIITPIENMTLMQQHAKGPVETLFWEDSGHCVHDRAHIVRPGMADFMARHLIASA
jgi:2,6-dihydroxypseudooxynicotine hydrolase